MSALVHTAPNTPKKTARPESDGRWVVAFALAAVWVVVGAAVFIFSPAKPTPESIASYLAGRANLPATDGHGRRPLMQQVAEDLKHLDAGQRAALWQRREMREFFESLDAREQAAFFELIWPRVNEMMQAFNKLTPGQRRQLVERAVRNMAAYDESHPQPLADAKVQQIIARGFQSFYSTATADSKLDLVPMIEELHRFGQASSVVR